MVAEIVEQGYIVASVYDDGIGPGHCVLSAFVLVDVTPRCMRNTNRSVVSSRMPFGIRRASFVSIRDRGGR